MRDRRICDIIRLPTTIINYRPILEFLFVCLFRRGICFISEMFQPPLSQSLTLSASTEMQTVARQWQ